MTPPDRSRPPVFVWMPAMSTLGLGASGDGDWRASSQVEGNVTSAGRSAGGECRWSMAAQRARSMVSPSRNNHMWFVGICAPEITMLFQPRHLREEDCQFWGEWGARQTVLVPRVGVARITWANITREGLNVRQGGMTGMSRWLAFGWFEDTLSGLISSSGGCYWRKAKTPC